MPAMINFSSGATSVRAACKAAKVSVVLTSRAFVEKARLVGLVGEIAQDVNIVYLEDIRGRIGFADKIAGLLAGAARA
jgi:acyl-[acyl-carrier-protein]-phospholipid O-acyltransferase/long-chain-fatty-acid--[acyl-carrier-protein] ligase